MVRSVIGAILAIKLCKIKGDKRKKKDRGNVRNRMYSYLILA